jgi:hypothetical protein
MKSDNPTAPPVYYPLVNLAQYDGHNLRNDDAIVVRFIFVLLVDDCSCIRKNVQ